MRFVLAIVAVAICLGRPCSAGESRSNAMGDAVAYRVMERLGAKPAKCPSFLELGCYVVQFCGQIPPERVANIAQTPAAVDAILADVDFSPPEMAKWDESTLDYAREVAIGDVVLRVALGRKGEIGVSYPMQFHKCDHLPIAKHSGPRGSWTAPVPVESTRVLPKYPEMARKARIVGGCVLLQAEVKADGTVGNVCVEAVHTPVWPFDEAAIEAVKQWRFKPGTENGQPRNDRFTVSIEYSLR